MTGQLMFEVDDLSRLPAEIADEVAGRPRWFVHRLGLVAAGFPLVPSDRDVLAGLGLVGDWTGRGDRLTWTGVVALRAARGLSDGQGDV